MTEHVLVTKSLLYVNPQASQTRESVKSYSFALILLKTPVICLNVSTMYTGTTLYCCPSSVVFCELFIGKYWLIFIKLKTLYFLWVYIRCLLYLIRSIWMAKLEATERSALNSRYYFLYFFRGIVAPGWYGG